MKMRPGGSSAQADGCGLSSAAGPAMDVVLCCHRSVYSSPPGRRMFSPPRILHEPSRFCYNIVGHTPYARHDLYLPSIPTSLQVLGRVECAATDAATPPVFWRQIVPLQIQC